MSVGMACLEADANPMPEIVQTISGVLRPAPQTIDGIKQDEGGLLMIRINR
jgi:hypothetical protein